MIPKTPRIKLSRKKLNALFQEIIEEYDHTCQGENCPGGFPLDDPHHIIFKSQGGDDTKENLILLCRFCHGRYHGTNYVK